MDKSACPFVTKITVETKIRGIKSQAIKSKASKSQDEKKTGVLARCPEPLQNNLFDGVSN